VLTLISNLNIVKNIISEQYCLIHEEKSTDKFDKFEYFNNIPRVNPSVKI